MEEHLAELNRAQKSKLGRAQNRAMELEDLRPSQDSQELEPTVKGSGGAAGLRRVIGGARKKKMPMMTGGAYTDGEFGVVNEPDPVPMVGGAMYGAKMAAHLMKTKGGAFLKDFMKGMNQPRNCPMDMSPASIACRSGKPAPKQKVMPPFMNVKPVEEADGGAMCGGAMDKRKARAQAVGRLMREKGMSLGEASRYVKEHGF